MRNVILVSLLLPSIVSLVHAKEKIFYLRGTTEASGDCSQSTVESFYRVNAEFEMVEMEWKTDLPDMPAPKLSLIVDNTPIMPHNAESTGFEGKTESFQPDPAEESSLVLFPYGEHSFEDEFTADDSLSAEWDWMRNGEDLEVKPMAGTLSRSCGDQEVAWDLILEAVPGNATIVDPVPDVEFDSTDFVRVFQSGKYEDEVEDNATWLEGDWNFDGDFGSGDLVTAFQDGRYEQEVTPPTLVEEAVAANAVAIPEPSSMVLLMIGLAACVRLTNRRPRRVRA